VTKNTPVKKRTNISNSFSKPSISLSLSAPQLTTPSYVDNYNNILREIQNERKSRLQMLEPISPNFTPLSSNKQVNELLKRESNKTIFSQLGEKYARSAQDVVNDSLHDDPTSNEMQSYFPAREAENIAPSLPVNVVDVEDISEYSNSNNEEEIALAQSVLAIPEARASDKVYSSNKTYANKQLLYEEYKNLVNSAFDENPQLREIYKLGSIKKLNSQKRIRNEMEKVQQLMNRR
jgi:hypothetical protein